MAEPIPKIEIETFAGIWLDYTAWFRSAKTKRGRRRAVDKVNAGTMVATFANESRNFDPEAVGTLVFPGQRIRLTADYLAVNWPIWQGTIDRIVQSYDPPRKSTAILECSDALAVLERTRLISTYEATMKPITKRVWYRFGEGSGATVAVDRSGNDRHGTYGGSPTLEHSPLMFVTDDTAVQFSTGANGDYVYMPPGTTPTALPFSINFLLNMPAPAVSAAIMYSGRNPNGLSIWMDSLGRINVQQMENGAIVAYARSSVPFSGNTYSLSIQFVAGSAIKILDHTNTNYTDGASAIGTASAPPVSDIYAFGFTSGGTFDEFFVVDYALTGTEMTELQFGENGWFPAGFIDRLDRVLDSVGWPSGDVVWMIDDETTYPIPADLAGVSALEHIRDVLNSIEGQIIVQSDGKLRFLGRAQRDSWNYAISSATFGDAVGELGYIGMDGYSLDTELVTNIVRREGFSTTTTASDAASIAKYGPRDNATEISQVKSLLLDPSLDYDLAKYRLAHYKEAIPTVDDLVISPRGVPTLWAQVLQRELTDKITLRRRPQNVGAVIEKEMIIEGIEHDIAPKRWIATWHIDAINALRFFAFDNTLWDALDWRFGA